MNFKNLNAKMKCFETLADRSVIPQMYIIARLDGRGFTKLTKEKYSFETPFDEKFSEMMVETVKHVLKSGIKILYGYTQSDEISLLFDINENSFSRKRSKYISILAGEVSAAFSMLIGEAVVFDCRLSELPNKELVYDYFQWRMDDAYKNSLNGHVYWNLRKQGYSKNEVTEKMLNMNVAKKNELLFSNGLNFNDLPKWQKRGIGVYWEEIKKEGINEINNQKMIGKKKNLIVNKELPLKEEYKLFIRKISS
ncbi:tRNA(His) guanylyltransferase Thg1 family protein [Apibacter raozihei]|uniref:tRNA(His) guanylyltransferase Thg1 family protein n=1 Tax=Apibacter raozihei TaxID=2500547 RepID=UPI000FE2E860|nr:tRNA(His) guanylyltransferase Thg1 family protein [Apibacter raozihei]